MGEGGNGTERRRQAVKGSRRSVLEIKRFSQAAAETRTAVGRHPPRVRVASYGCTSVPVPVPVPACRYRVPCASSRSTSFALT